MSYEGYPSSCTPGTTEVVLRHGSAYSTGGLNKGSCGTVKHMSLFEHHSCHFLNSVKTKQIKTSMEMDKIRLLFFKMLQPSEISVWTQAYYPPRQIR